VSDSQYETLPSQSGSSEINVVTVFDFAGTKGMNSVCSL
jgi:hypothetical protein